MSAKRRCQGSVIEKRGLWYAVITIGWSSTGQQVRHWSKGCKNRRTAERSLAELLLEGRVSQQTRNTVESVVSEYVRHDVTSRGQRSPTTTQRYWGLLENMRPLFHERVDQLCGPTIETLYERLLQRGLSHTTVHHVHNLMSAAFRWAKTRKVALVTRNPFDWDDIEKPRRAKSNARSFTIEQAQRALGYLTKTKHGNALIFCLATGCRRGETCGLKSAAVDFNRKVAIVRESRYQVRGIVGQKLTKADRIREVPLNDTAMRALLSERERQAERKKLAGDAWIDSDHVFTDELGSPLSPMALTNAFGRCARKAKLPTTAMHHLRHTAATFILSGGGNPAAAAQILGHSEKATTLRLYGHVIGLDEVRAARFIDRALEYGHALRGRKRRTLIADGSGNHSNIGEHFPKRRPLSQNRH